MCLVPYKADSLIGAVALTSGFAKGNAGSQIWLDEIGCRGFETRLIDCPGVHIGAHNCQHSQDAGVRCSTDTTCTTGDIRLRGGTANQGRVEICRFNIWGTVCNDQWDAVDAQVACMQLGFANFTGKQIYSETPLYLTPSTSIILLDSVAISSGFTRGAGQIWLDNVLCVGNEIILDNCRANAIGMHNCSHSEDAGVRCVGTANTCLEGDIRLQGGNSSQGRVEICFNNVWGTVCHDNWRDVDAQVACKQLGFTTIGKTHKLANIIKLYKEL